MKRDLTLKVDGLSLPGEVHLPETGRQCPGLCLCHGIPSGISNPTDGGYPALAERFCRAGFVTLIFNFRGCGPAQGNLDMLGWTRDLGAAIDYLAGLEEVEKSHICLLGSSAGAAASVYVTARDQRISALVTFASPATFTFVSNREQAISTVNHFRTIGLIRDPHFPPSIDEWLDGFSAVSPISWIDKISPRPLLLIHGDKDDLIPVGQAHELYARARKPKEIVIIPGAGHRLRLEEKAVDTALEWLKEKSR